MILEPADTLALFAHLPRGVRARLSMAVMRSPADIALYLTGALNAVDALDIDATGGLIRGETARTDDVKTAVARFTAAFDGSKEAAKVVDKRLGDLLSRDERMQAMAGAIEAAGKRIELRLVDAAP